MTHLQIRKNKNDMLPILDAVRKEKWEKSEQFEISVKFLIFLYPYW
jgi:hypothetical protein